MADIGLGFLLLGRDFILTYSRLINNLTEQGGGDRGWGMGWLLSVLTMLCPFWDLDFSAGEGGHLRRQCRCLPLPEKKNNIFILEYFRFPEKLQSYSREFLPAPHLVFPWCWSYETMAHLPLLFCRVIRHPLRKNSPVISVWLVVSVAEVSSKDAAYSVKSQPFPPLCSDSLSSEV